MAGELPNVLLVVLDAARADHFSCYGYERKTTPNIDRLAAEGFRFSRAVSTSSWTLPSHASLFTGLLPEEHGTTAQNNWLIDRIPTLAELMRVRGYRTGGFSNNPFVDKQQNLSRGFETFVPVWSLVDLVTDEIPYNTEYTDKVVKEFIDSDSNRKPWFVFINFMEPHMPYLPPEPYRSQYLKPGQEITARVDSAIRYAEPLQAGTLKLTRDELDAMVAIYDGAINYNDKVVEDIIKHIQGRGELDNTIVIVLSDHGELFGEHNFFVHGGMLPRQLINIPLIIRYPKVIEKPAVRDELVSICDIYNTLSGYLGLEEQSIKSAAPVRDLFAKKIAPAPAWSLLKVGRTSNSDRIYMHDSKSLWTPDDMHYIDVAAETTQVYNLKSDFDETNNLIPAKIKKEEAQAKVNGYASGITELEQLPEDLVVSGDWTNDPQQTKAMKALGYVGDSEITSSSEGHPKVLERMKTGIFFMKNDSLDAAEREIRTTLKMSPDNYIARKYLGAILFNRKKFAESERELKAVLGKTNMDLQVSLLIAACCVELKKYDEALEYFDKALKINPSDIRAGVNAARVLASQGKNSTAVAYLNDLVKNNPGNLIVQRQITSIMFEFGYLKPAKILLSRELDQEDTAEARLMMAAICKGLGQKVEMHKHLKKLLNMKIPDKIREKVIEELQNQ